MIRPEWPTGRIGRANLARRRSQAGIPLRALYLANATQDAVGPRLPSWAMPRWYIGRQAFVRLPRPSMVLGLLMGPRRRHPWPWAAPWGLSRSRLSATWKTSDRIRLVEAAPLATPLRSAPIIVFTTMRRSWHALRGQAFTYQCLSAPGSPAKGAHS
jgi:hypothetical protein